MNNILLCIFAAFVGIVAAREPAKTLPVDKLRWEYLQLEDDLWNTVLDYAENNIGDKEEGPEVMIIRKFGQFGDKMSIEMGEVRESNKNNFISDYE